MNNLEKRIRKATPKFIKWHLLRLFKFIIQTLGITPRYIIIEGKKMFLDNGDSAKYSTEDYEPQSFEITKSLIKKGDVVIDLGACLGYYSLMLAKGVGKKGEVHCFEVEKNNFKLLSKSIKESGYGDRVYLNQMAIIDKIGTDRLSISKHTGGHVLYNHKHTYKTEIVKTASIDELFSKEIDFIKIDIDGSEARALIGARKTIKKSPNLKMLIEFVPERIEATFGTPKDFIKLIKSLGLKIQCINEVTGKIEKGDLKHLIELVELHSNMSNSNGKYVNLLCTKEIKKIPLGENK